MGISKEQASIRDLFASNIAGVLIEKAGIKIDWEICYTRELERRDDAILRSVAFLAYKLADKLMDERIRKS
jgi:hypothetical protein